LMRRKGPVCFYAFDLLWLDGNDLRERPLYERKAQLRGLISKLRADAKTTNQFDSELKH
jgi:ATP-dependent DNA ligase